MFIGVCSIYVQIYLYYNDVLSIASAEWYSYTKSKVKYLTLVQTSCLNKITARHG